MLSPALQLKHIYKYYHHVKALDDVSIDIAPGSIHGIIGENGAGKSTLLKIAYGLLEPDEGAIYVDGVKVNITSPQHAVENGIGMLHQGTSWLEQQSIIDNILLGENIQSFLSKAKVKARHELEQMCREFGFTFSLDLPMAQLDYSQRQMVDILRSLYRGAKVLVLDEPMALLSISQSTHLFDLLKLLKMQGISIVIVAHKLAVLYQLCDVITVMREGEVISNVDPKALSLGQLSKLMVGREITLPHPSSGFGTPKREQRLKLTNLAIKSKKRFGFNRHQFSLSNIDFYVDSHEIVALVGLHKAGHEDLIEVLAGTRHFTDGRITVANKRFKPNNHYDVQQARELGIAHVPDPLLGIGLVKELPMYESAMLGYHHNQFNHFNFFKNSQYWLDCEAMMKLWDIRPCLPNLTTGAFSGGNQQKMVLAREISSSPELLLLNHPSNGVDVGALEGIYRQLFSLREQGASVVFCSNDLDEVMSLSDRVILFERGQIIGQYYTQQTNKNDLSLMLSNEAISE